MDTFFNHMQVWRLADRKRQLPYHLQVDKIGYLPNKYWEFHPVRLNEKCSFNLIIDGTGVLRSNGRTWKIKAPCLFVPRLLPNASYKPDEKWTELYIVYSGSCLESLDKSGYLRGSNPLYPLADLSRIKPSLDQLFNHLQNLHLIAALERIDSSCESLIRECLLSQSNAYSEPECQLMNVIRLELDKQYLIDPDIAQISKQNGMSQMKFRRLWSRYFDLPPKQYVLQKRIDVACTLLAENSFRINEVAEKVGFADPLYFTRLFKKKTGKTPSGFRNLFKA